MRIPSCVHAACIFHPPVEWRGCKPAHSRGVWGVCIHTRNPIFGAIVRFFGRCNFAGFGCLIVRSGLSSHPVDYTVNGDVGTGRIKPSNARTGHSA